MGILGIEIPEINEEQEIEIDVRVNGIKKQYQYRVELFYWADCKVDPDNRVECIREMVNTYDQSWELTHLGLPTDEYIPITFRKLR